MSRILKGLLVCSVSSIFLAIACSNAMAQVGYGFPPLWYFPSFSPLQVPTWEDPFEGEGDILVDNFEYWDGRPYHHGWIQIHPEHAYPMYGFGLGAGAAFCW